MRIAKCVLFLNTEALSRLQMCSSVGRHGGGFQPSSKCSPADHASDANLIGNMDPEVYSQIQLLVQCSEMGRMEGEWFISLELATVSQKGTCTSSSFREHSDTVNPL